MAIVFENAEVLDAYVNEVISVSMMGENKVFTQLIENVTSLKRQITMKDLEALQLAVQTNKQALYRKHE